MRGYVKHRRVTRAITMSASYISEGLHPGHRLHGLQVGDEQPAALLSIHSRAAMQSCAASGPLA
eukprot:6214504-Pleurochrysis_carterae.AAC.1